LKNIAKPTNLTSAGINNKKIIYTFLGVNSNSIISKNKRYLISAVNIDDKSYSLYSVNFGNSGPKRIYEAASDFGGPYEEISSRRFIKSEKSDGYLLGIENTSNALNYFFTSDFKHFVALSEEHPEAQYNWITSNLLTYEDKDGNICQAILYKPQNFDSALMHPVVLFYYMDQTFGLHRYYTPDPSSIGLNVPLLVSNGYIVIKPDIYRKAGAPGEAVLSSINAVADYISKFNWVDSNNIAIAGHSLGGWETNYILVNSNRFKAAFSGAGVSSLIDLYNDRWESGDSRQSYVKDGMFNMRNTLTEAREKYIENSPILYADRVQTPVLMLHNQEDNAVPVGQSLNFFVALRSLNKPAWLLQYNNEKHTISEEYKRIDFQKRLKGFFDFYLLNKPIPDWMTHHIDPNAVSEK